MSWLLSFYFLFIFIPFVCVFKVSFYAISQFKKKTTNVGVNRDWFNRDSHSKKSRNDLLSSVSVSWDWCWYHSWNNDCAVKCWLRLVGLLCIFCLFVFILLCMCVCVFFFFKHFSLSLTKLVLMILGWIGWTPKRYVIIVGSIQYHPKIYNCISNNAFTRNSNTVIFYK